MQEPCPYRPARLNNMLQKSGLVTFDVLAGVQITRPRHEERYIDHQSGQLLECFLEAREKILRGPEVRRGPAGMFQKGRIYGSIRLLKICRLDVHIIGAFVSIVDAGLQRVFPVAPSDVIMASGVGKSVCGNV